MIEFLIRRVHLHRPRRRPLPGREEIPTGRLASGPRIEKQGQILNKTKQNFTSFAPPRRSQSVPYTYISSPLRSARLRASLEIKMFVF